MRRRDPLFELVGNFPTTPRRGWGSSILLNPEGDNIKQASAASSIVELLCAEYGSQYKCTSTLATKIALLTHEWTASQNGEALQIRNTWWVALTEMLPLGPLPGLLVIHTSDQMECDRTELLRVPGPVDERVLAVIRHEQHFDPVWWEAGNKYEAVCPCLPSPIERISATLTADFGPARGALRILGAAYCRSLPFLPPDSVQCTGSHAEEALTEIGNWEPWIQYIEHAGILSDVDKTRAVIVLLGCRHPVHLTQKYGR